MNSMNGFKYILLFYLCHFLAANIALAQQFKVYAFLPSSDAQILSNHGIMPIDVVYENRYMTNHEIDPDKIKKIALDALKRPDVPISFDVEFGNRYKPDTVVPSILTILSLFRDINVKSQVGIYATIPQNTYGIKPDDASYKQLNKQYERLIDRVDYISPSLYNYEKIDFKIWSANTKFILKTAKKYPNAKPIIPYISPIIRLGASSKARNGHLVIELSEKEMTKRLEALYALGASGCIIWASSQDRDASGQRLKFNPTQGFGKAVVMFIRNHSAPSE